MKNTLLQVVQKTLEVMDSDAVGTISDTEEAGQVASIAQDVYYELVSKQENWPWLHRLVVMDSASPTTPTLVPIRTSVMEITSIRYNVAESASEPVRYRELPYMAPQEFLNHVYSRDTTDTTNIIVMNVLDTSDAQGSLVALPILRTSQPQFYTTFNDKEIVLDAYDTAVESNIQSNKFAVLGYIIPRWTMEDAFVPDLPAHMHPMYLADVKAACFRYLKQMTSVRDERKVAHDTASFRTKSVGDGQRPRQTFGRNQNH